MGSKLIIIFLTLSACLPPRLDCAARSAGPQEFGAGLKRHERGGRAAARDSKDADGAGQAEEVVRMNTLLTLLDVTVTDGASGRPVEGLTKGDFVVVEDGVPQQLDNLTRGDDAARRHVPEVPDFGTPVTLRHLLHHTSGLRDFLEVLEMAGHRTGDIATEKSGKAKNLSFNKVE